MEIEGTTFGTITIDGKTYEHDVIIRLSGEVVKRKKKLSKKYYGTSHVLSKDEAKFVFESGCEQLILGSGQMGNVHLSPEAEAYFAKKGCKVVLQSTPEAIHLFNRSHAKKIGLFHVTCCCAVADMRRTITAVASLSSLCAVAGPTRKCCSCRTIERTISDACVCRKSDSAIMVMKSAEDGRRYDAAHVLVRAMDRSVLVERPMSPQLIIIGGVLRQNPA